MRMAAIKARNSEELGAKGMNLWEQKTYNPLIFRSPENQLLGTRTVVYDVVIVGSGPAGSLAAIELAQHGLKVCLLERSTHPRYKTCGGGVLARAVRLLPFDIQNAVAHECHTVELRFAGGGHGFRTTRSTPIIFMTIRSAFDRLLVDEAIKYGVVLREESPVTGVLLGTDGVIVRTAAEEIFGRFVIGADGVDSIVARASGWNVTPVAVPALECEVPVDPATYARFHGLARFDMDHPRYGYSWVFPKEGCLSVGVGLLTARRDNPRLKEAFRLYIEQLGIKPVGPLDIHGARIPVRPRKGALGRDRVLLVGDAAGLADPITAEGITHALLSGKLAATALIERKLSAGTVEEHYCRLLEEEILSELRIAGRLARFFYGHPMPRNLLFRVHGQRFCEKVTDIMMGERRYRDFNLSMPSLARYL